MTAALFVCAWLIGGGAVFFGIVAGIGIEHQKHVTHHVNGIGTALACGVILALVATIVSFNAGRFL